MARPFAELLGDALKSVVTVDNRAGAGGTLGACEQLGELGALAKSEPGKLDYGSAGNGTPGHLTAEMFKIAAGIDMRHVPYKGGALAQSDLLAGRIKILFDPVQSTFAQVHAGNLRALAVSSEARSLALPDVPTIAESGFPGFETTAWWGVFAPAKLPSAMATTLAAQIAKNDQSFRDKMEPLGVHPTVLTLEDFAEFQGAEISKWGKAIHDFGVDAIISR